MPTFERPFDAIRRELATRHDELSSDDIRPDLDRARRTGIPEFVLGGKKSTVQIVAALTRLAEANGRAVATRLSSSQMDDVVLALAPDLNVERHEAANALIASRTGSEAPHRDGVVGVISAGTSDARVAAEAALIAREMGCQVLEAHDVGVAGLHRLVQPLEAMIDRGVHAIVVAAGMDGALPSVVAGLVAVPVIGLPTSVGYGYGGSGEGALMTMLQSCAPGLVVVNIDNGVGAGATAALIANQSGC